MEAEIPIALIRTFQSTAREQAGVPWYDPSEPAIPSFPASLREAVAEADSTVPPYLKCSQCRTALPRGLQSAICVHCGVEQRREIPLSFSFISTAACRNLLESLDLDGSEAVILDTEPQKSSKGKDTAKSTMTLSSLLNLELRWPPERKETKTVSSNNLIAQDNAPLNLSAADLNNFLIETKTVSPGTHNTSQLSFDSETFDVFQNLRSSDAVTAMNANGKGQYVTTSTKTNEKELTSTNTNEKGQYMPHSTHVSSNSDNFAAFKEQEHSIMVEGSTDKDDAGSTEFFGDWQADFQSAGPGTSLFHDSSMLDKNALYNDKEQRNEAEPTNKTILSSADDHWIPDDLWQASSDVPPNNAKNGESAIAETGNAIENSCFDSLWPVDSGGLSAPVSKNHEHDDSFDVWQDFSTSKVSSEAHPDLLPRPVAEIVSSALNKNDDDDDSYDVWQDFSGSKVAFETLPSSVTQSVTPEKVCSSTSGYEVDDSFDVWQDFSSSKGVTGTGEGILLSDNASGNKLADIDFEDTEFGNFVQSGVASFHDSSTDTKNIPPEASKPDRDNPMEIKQNYQYDILAKNNQNEVSSFDSATDLPDPSRSHVESLLSQMHDLTFMLKDDLSIPRKVESFTYPS